MHFIIAKSKHKKQRTHINIYTKITPFVFLKLQFKRNAPNELSDAVIFAFIFSLLESANQVDLPPHV
jgi:hypothetical protein